jgi:imidazolonepropionase-like amidohydrolase
MKKYRVWLVLAALAPAAAKAQVVDSVSFYLHKFAQNIGKETYYRRVSDSGVSYAIHFRFVDRGSPVPLDARMVLTAAGEPVSLWVKGNTSRFSTIDDSIVLHGEGAWVRVGDQPGQERTVHAPAFPVAGYSPGTVQMLLLQYWRQHGKTVKLSLLPGGTVSIHAAGYDTLRVYGQQLVLERTVISGLIWGNELVWTDQQGGLVCLITNDAEGDKLEMMRDRYEYLLPQLISRAATYGMELFAQAMKGVGAGVRGAGGYGSDGGHAAGSDRGAGAAGEAGTLAVVGGKMVDVATGEVTNDAVILIRNGKIVKTGTKATVPVPADAKIIHAEGKVVLPGLWDMHAHFEQAEWGPAYLAAGVTTVRDCGNEFDYINAVKRAIDQGIGVGPHILKAGIIDGPGPLGLGIIRAANKYQAIAAVRRYKDSGFVQIKIYSSVQPPVVKAICDEAHRLGMTVTGHIPEGMNLEQGVDSGMDMVNHIQYVPPILALNPDKTINWDDLKTAEGLDFIREHGTVIDPTLGVFEMIFRSTKDTITDMEPAFYTLPEPLQVLFRTMGMAPEQAVKYKPRFHDMEKLVKVLHDRGVPIVAGTDMGFPGYSVDRELELYVESGLTPLEAIRTATVVPALVMRQASVSGSLMPGRSADLIIVNGDPLHHIRDIRKVQVVIKDGRVYDPAVLHKLAGFGR